MQPGNTAKKSFDKASAAIKSCGQFVSTNNGHKITFKLGALSFPKLGDETFALRLGGTTPEGIDLGLDVVVVRIGQTLIAMENAGAGTPDSSLIETVTRKAVEKVKATVSN